MDTVIFYFSKELKCQKQQKSQDVKKKKSIYFKRWIRTLDPVSLKLMSKFLHKSVN